MVADALGWIPLHMLALMVIAFDLIKQFRDRSSVCEMTPISVKLGMPMLTNNSLDEIIESHNLDLEFVNRRVLVNQGK